VELLSPFFSKKKKLLLRKKKQWEVIGIGNTPVIIGVLVCFDALWRPVDCPALLEGLIR
jgi:hypothetical protein